MLKKLYQKDGIITIFNNNQFTNQDMKLCYHIIKDKNKDKDKNKKFDHNKKEYYLSKGFTYQD